MKESIGMTALINIIIIFIVLIFAFLFAIISYNKAFKVNSRIINALEKYEGYNSLSKDEIDILLMSIGYRTGDSSKCASKRGEGTLMVASEFANDPSSEKYQYCIYYHPQDGDDRHYSYGVVSYLQIEIPIFGSKINVPIYAKTRRIYKMNS